MKSVSLSNVMKKNHLVYFGVVFFCLFCYVITLLKKHINCITQIPFIFMSSRGDWISANLVKLIYGKKPDADIVQCVFLP